MLDTPEACIYDVCFSETLAEAAQKFEYHQPLLETYCFILAARSGIVPGNAREKGFSGTGKIKTLFSSDHLVFLDRRTSFEMKLCDRAALRIDYSISLDTNAVSYLWPYIEGGRVGAADLVEVLRFIARDDVYVDPMPYFLENTPNLLDLSNAGPIFDKVRGYEILRNLDPAALEQGVIRSGLPAEEITARAHALLSDFYVRLTRDGNLQTILFRRDFMLCQLLKMVTIQLGMARRPVDDKLAALFDFYDADLSAFDWRGIVVAREYFSRGQNFSFFGKIHKGRDGLFAALEGMAWDMWHVRQLEENITMKLEEESEYFVPALLTFDRALAEMIDLYPLKGIAFSTEDKLPMPFYAADPMRIVSDDPARQEAFRNRYYSPAARQRRAGRRDSVRDGMGRLKAALVEEVERLSGVRNTSIQV